VCELQEDRERITSAAADAACTKLLNSFRVDELTRPCTKVHKEDPPGKNNFKGGRQGAFFRPQIEKLQQKKKNKEEGTRKRDSVMLSR
jgi:hypothetical protein